MSMGRYIFNRSMTTPPMTPTPLVVIGASDPSNLQPAASNINNNQFLAAVPCESRESETKAKLVIIVTSCPESTPIVFAYATTVEVVVVEEKIPQILIHFWITPRKGEREKAIQMDIPTR